MTPLELSRERRNQKRQALAAAYSAEIAAVESRKGKLPKKSQAEIDLLKSQIDQARTDRQAARDAVQTTKATAVALRDKLQADLDAATKPADRQTIRANLDNAKAAVDAAQAELDRAAADLAALLQAKEDALYQERITKGTLTADDAPRVQRDKDRQSEEVASKRAKAELLTSNNAT